MKLLLDRDEAWCIHEHVRLTRNAPEYGTEHDGDFVRRLWVAILDLEDRQGLAKVEFSRGELLMVTRQVSAQLMQGQRPLGRDVLKKAFAALVQEEEPDAIAIPDAFLGADLTDTDPDGGTDSGADAPVEPGRDLPTTAAGSGAQD